MIVLVTALALSLESSTQLLLRIVTKAHHRRDRLCLLSMGCFNELQKCFAQLRSCNLFKLRNVTRLDN
jgi:hypothetical protein